MQSVVGETSDSMRCALWRSCQTNSDPGFLAVAIAPAACVGPSGRRSVFTT